MNDKIYLKNIQIYVNIRQKFCYYYTNNFFTNIRDRNVFLTGEVLNIVKSRRSLKINYAPTISRKTQAKRAKETVGFLLASGPSCRPGKISW